MLRFQICFGYRPTIFRQLIFFLLILLSAGTLILVFYWKPEWRIFLSCKLTDIQSAQILLIQDMNGRYFVVNIEFIDFERDPSGSVNGGYQSTNGTANRLKLDGNDGPNESSTDPDSAQLPSFLQRVNFIKKKRCLQ